MKNNKVLTRTRGIALLLLGIIAISFFAIFNPITSHAAGGSTTYSITVWGSEKTLSGYQPLYTRHLNILEQDKTVVLSMYDIHNHRLWSGEIQPSSTMCLSYYVGPDVKFVSFKSKKGKAKVKYNFTR